MRPLFLGLVALAAGLTATAALEVRLLSAPDAVPLADRAVAPRPSVAAPAAAVTDGLPAMEATTLTRPLFEPSRRPSAENARAAAGAGPSLPRLAGIIVGPAGRAVIFVGPGGGRPLVLAEGDKLDGVVIQSIGVDAVVVLSRDGNHVLHPTFDPKPPAARAFVPPVAGMRTPDAPGTPTRPGLTGRPLVATPADAAKGVTP